MYDYNSMDAFFLTQTLERETYVNAQPKMSLLSMLQFIISLTISIYAASLAWSAGSSDSAFFRIFMTVVAFMFSTLYIIGYIIFKGFKAM
jgi:uncharacterized membrane protein